MGTLYALCVYRIKGPYPKTRRELIKLQFNEYNAVETAETVAMITVLDKLPGPSCEIIQLDQTHTQLRSA